MIKELRKKDTKDLKKLLTEKREEARAFRFGTAGATTRNVKTLRNVRHDVARILTVLAERTNAAK